MTTIRQFTGRAQAAGRVHSSRRSARPATRVRRPLRRVAFALITLILLGVVGTAISLYAQGYRVWVVHTGSMEPDFMPGDLVIDRPVKGAVHKGEVITFLHSDLTSDVVTHRVTDVTKAGLIHTKGDANSTADVWDIRPDQVQGTVQFKIKSLGYFVVFLQQPAGIGALATLIFAVVLLWQMFFPSADDETAESGATEDADLPGELVTA
jgi:signal peptidase